MSIQRILAWLGLWAICQERSLVWRVKGIRLNLIIRLDKVKNTSSYATRAIEVLINFTYYEASFAKACLRALSILQTCHYRWEFFVNDGCIPLIAWISTLHTCRKFEILVWFVPLLIFFHRHNCTTSSKEEEMWLWGANSQVSAPI